MVGRAIGGGRFEEEEASFQLRKLFRLNCKTGDDGDQNSTDIDMESDTFCL